MNDYQPLIDHLKLYRRAVSTSTLAATEVTRTYSALQPFKPCFRQWKQWRPNLLQLRVGLG
jgi:hypothetical protein